MDLQLFRLESRDFSSSGYCGYFLILWMEDRHITRPLPIQYYMEERRQLFTSTVGYEPVMLVWEAQDCAHPRSISVA
jgi:hypothetical protein